MYVATAHGRARQDGVNCGSNPSLAPFDPLSSPLSLSLLRSALRPLLCLDLRPRDESWPERCCLSCYVRVGVFPRDSVLISVVLLLLVRHGADSGALGMYFGSFRYDLFPRACC